MKKLTLIVGLLWLGVAAYAQNFELSETAEHYQISPNQILRIPLRLRNSSEKAQLFVIRVIKGEMADTQKGYFCLGNSCFDASIEEFVKRLEPGETLTDLQYSFESGIQPGQTSLKIEVLPKGVPSELIERSISLLVEEKSGKSVIFQSREITIHDVYPNPVQDQAFIDYKIHVEAVKAKIIIHNVLGRPMGDFELPHDETRIKILADDLVPGIYFYTVYLNNQGILTRKLVVRK